MLLRSHKAQKTEAKPPTMFVTLTPEAHVSIAEQIDETSAAVNFASVSKSFRALTWSVVSNRPSLMLHSTALALMKQMQHQIGEPHVLKLKRTQYFATFSSANRGSRPMGFTTHTADLRRSEDSRLHTLLDYRPGDNFFTLKIQNPTGGPSSYDVVPHENGWVEDLQLGLGFRYEPHRLLDKLVERGILTFY